MLERSYETKMGADKTCKYRVYYKDVHWDTPFATMTRETGSQGFYSRATELPDARFRTVAVEFPIGYTDPSVSKNKDFLYVAASYWLAGSYLVSRRAHEKLPGQLFFSGVINTANRSNKIIWYQF